VTGLVLYLTETPSTVPDHGLAGRALLDVKILPLLCASATNLVSVVEIVAAFAAERMSEPFVLVADVGSGAWIDAIGCAALAGDRRLCGLQGMLVMQSASAAPALRSPVIVQETTSQSVWSDLDVMQTAIAVVHGSGLARAQPFLRNSRLSSIVRSLLMHRIHTQPVPESCFDQHEEALLDHVIEQIVPGHALGQYLVRSVKRHLAEGRGDGWRVADLPTDAVAYRQGLRHLDHLAGGAFCALSDAERRAVIQHALQSSEAGSGMMSSVVFSAWFQDATADVLRLWMSHPAVMDEIGYDGLFSETEAGALLGFDVDHTYVFPPTQTNVMSRT